MNLDQGSVTQLMILLSIHQGDEKPASLAKKLGITVQGVQYHTKILRKKGYIDDEYSLTKEGFHFLESGLLSLKDFVTNSLSKIDDLTTWEAISSGPVKEGDTVHLGMHDGYLYCSPTGNEPTTGVARNSANDGEIVLVSNLSGLISVKIGTVHVFVLSGMNAADGVVEIKETLVQGNVISITAGELSHTFANKFGLREDVRYGSFHAAFDAATRGVDAVILISERRFHYDVSEMLQLQSKFPEVNLKIKYL
ncbi:MAG TPA: hypothetical protein VKU79_00700 [Thermoplasmataceae archaeon]|nr:hypothetical protein [Thermoplasmataceae archaeon]